MPWTAKKKAMAFSAVLVLVSVGFLASAAASTDGILAPFRRGDEYGHERPLSRNGVALAVLVGGFTDGGPARAEGAVVSVHRLADDAAGDGPARSVTTDASGRAVFQLPRGAYRVAVEWSGFAAEQRFRLLESQRAGVYFDGEGTAHWRVASHGDLERAGDVRGLLVRVAENRSGERVPVVGATVRLHRAVGDDAGVAVPVQEQQTNERGLALFQVHKGDVRVEASWSGGSAAETVRVERDLRVTFFFDGDRVLTQVDQGRPPPRGPPPPGGRSA